MLPILRGESIPIENATIMMLYTYALLFQKNGKIPSKEDEEAFMHNDSRGCIFDLTDNYEELVFSCVTPIICEECMVDLKKK